jgi:hypothetical protein
MKPCRFMVAKKEEICTEGHKSGVRKASRFISSEASKPGRLTYFWDSSNACSILLACPRFGTRSSRVRKASRFTSPERSNINDLREFERLRRLTKPTRSIVLVLRSRFLERGLATHRSNNRGRRRGRLGRTRARLGGRLAPAP